MGSYVELNDTLQLTTKQGFPAEIFDLPKHQQKPIQLADVQDKIFQFHGKESARIFQLDPVRVYFVHNIDEKWLFWGHAQIQSLHIEKLLDANGKWAGKWVTSGTFRVDLVYDPEYQRTFSTHEAPPGKNYFKS